MTNMEIAKDATQTAPAISAGAAGAPREAIKWDSPADELVGVAKMAFALIDKFKYPAGHVKLIVPHANWGLQLQRACEAQGVTAAFNMPMEHLSAGATVELAKLEILANPQSAGAREILLKVADSLGTQGANAEEKLAAFIERNAGVKGFSLLNVARLRNFHEFDHSMLHIEGDEGAAHMLDIVRAQLAAPTMPEHVNAISIEHMLYAHKQAEVVILVACVDGFVPGAGAYELPTDEARAQAVSTWREAFNKCANLASGKTYISLFTRAEEQLAKQAHLRIARTKQQNGQMLAMTKPAPFINEWGLQAPSTAGGQAVLRQLGLN